MVKVLNKVNFYYGIITFLVCVAFALWWQQKSAGQQGGGQLVSSDSDSDSDSDPPIYSSKTNSSQPISQTFQMSLPLSDGPLVDPERSTTTNCSSLANCSPPNCNLLTTLDEERKYAQKMIDQYRSENFKMSYYINKLVKQIDQGSTDVVYRKRLSNKHYPVQPHTAYFPDHSPLNLRQDDFSNKTFSESKFLAPTQSSDFYGDNVHSGSYLCDDQYPYTDRQVLGQSQIEVTPQVKQY